MVLDAGTGLWNLSAALGGEPFHGTIVLSHLHWDHTFGLPFFGAGDRDDAVVSVIGPDQPDGAGLEEVLEGLIGPPFFPIRPSQLRGRWTFAGIEPGHHRIGEWEVTALEIPHQVGRTFGVRVTDGTATVAYLPDHAPWLLGPGPDGLGELHPAALCLATDADLLVHDAQLTAAELPTARSFGHSAAEYAVALATAAGSRRLALFHHDPHRTDDEVDALAASLAHGSVEVLVAHEGLTVELTPSA
jgi:ribonuclease BN (tRNA processing enzyme)